MRKQNHTSQRGITLIALIITIIVMLILVGVTVNVALTGGLFTKATEASKQMQVEAEKEELLSSVVAAIGYDGKVDLGEIQLPNGWKGSNGKYTSPKGNSYKVDENGKITEENDDSNGFYGYEYYLDMGEGNVGYFYILDNGLIIQKAPDEKTIKGYIYMAMEYSLEDNVISFIGEQGIISDDYKTIEVVGENAVLTKNDNKKLEFEGLNSEYNIYANAIYYSSDSKKIITTFDILDNEYGGYEIHLVLFNISTMENIRGYTVEEFLETEGVEVSQDGKQIVLDGITYYLLEV